MNLIKSVSAMITLSAITLCVAHADPIGFSGKKTFSFTGGAGNDESVVVSGNHMKISYCGATSCSTEYAGPVTNPVHMKGGTTYWFHNGKVYWIDQTKTHRDSNCDGNGAGPNTAQFEANTPCIANLN